MAASRVSDAKKEEGKNANGHFLCDVWNEFCRVGFGERESLMEGYFLGFSWKLGRGVFW